MEQKTKKGTAQLWNSTAVKVALMETGEPPAQLWC